MRIAVAEKARAAPGHARLTGKMDSAPQPRQAGFLAAFFYAWEGLVATVAHQQNMKIHVVSGVLVGCVGSGIPLGLPEKVTLIFCVMMVFFAEVMNSAVEALVDLHTEDFRKLAKVAKDTAAAGVLVLSIGTLALFAAILVHDWQLVLSHPAQVQRQFLVGAPMTALGAVLPLRRPRSKWLDVPPLLGAMLLWAITLEWTASPVFSAMIGSLLILQGAAAWELRWRAHPMAIAGSSTPRA